MRRVAAALVALTLALVAAACGGSSTSGSGVRSKKDLSIVVLGDSVAAGEGIAYGYTYDASARPPHWTGGVPNPAWLPPNPSCHRTAQAYGNVVAATLHGRLTNFACTGASYELGVVGPQPETDNPAQFGNWSTRQNLNAEYDRAAPDVVLVTLGADDLRFTQVVVSCVEAAFLHPGECVASNPGAVVQQDVLDAMPTLATHLRALVAAIRDRAKAHHRESPFIVFTNYYDPLPAAGADTSLRACPDAAGLSSAQLAFLRGLLDQLDATIQNALRNEPDVQVADLRNAFDGHQWCSADPWAYGPSVLLQNGASQAPFHPTPRGQQVIAAEVLAKFSD